MTKRTSNSYVCTLDVNSAVDIEKLQTFKAIVKALNKDSSLRYKKRVVIRGRKPLNKAEVVNRWTGKKSFCSYDFAGNVVGGIANATKLDVYIYDRRD